MSDLFFGTDLFSELDRMQRQMASLFGGFPSGIRSGRFGAFPPVNIGTTDDSIQIVAFAPGIKQDKFEVSIDKGLLTISGEREAAHPEVRPYAQERFVGTFRRVSNCRRAPTRTKSRRAMSTAACLSVLANGKPQSLGRSRSNNARRMP